MSACDGTPVNYSGNVPSLSDLEWDSQPFFKYSLFGGLHKAADATLAWIFPNHEDYSGYRINPEDLLDFSEDNVDVDDIIWKNRGPLAFAVIGLILAAILTIFGIGWCCMKCCSACCCSRKSRASISDRYNNGYFDDSDLLNKFGHEERKEKWLRIGCGVTLIVWIIFSLAFLGSLFAFNGQLRDSINDIPHDLNLSLHDAEKYLLTSQRQINGVLVNSYSNFSYTLNCVLDEMGAPRTAVNSSIPQFEQLAALSKQLQEPDIERSLNLTIETLSEYCADKSCEGQEELTNNFSTMAHVLSQIRALTRSLEEYATETLPKLRMADQDLITINDIRGDIQQEGENLHATAQALTDTLDDVIDAVRDARHDLKEVEVEFEKSDSPLYASILVIILFLFFVTILFFVGAMLSFVGKSHSLVNKSRSCTLSCGLLLMFIFGGILWIFTMACFLLSGLITQVVPANLRALENNSTESVCTAPPGVRADYKIPTYGYIARNCREGNSAYVTFDLCQVYDVESIKNLTNILKPRVERLRVANSAAFGMIEEIAAETSNFTQRLQDAQNQSASISANLQHAITALVKLANDNEGSALGNSDADGNRKLAKSAVINSVNTLSKLRTTELLKLKTGLESLRNMLSSTASDFSNVRATPEENFFNYVADFADFVHDEIYLNVGECQPMYNALNSTINIFTYKVGSPIAGFWLSLNIVLLFFFGSIITATVLQRL